MPSGRVKKLNGTPQTCGFQTPLKQSVFCDGNTDQAGSWHKTGITYNWSCPPPWANGKGFLGRAFVCRRIGAVDSEVTGGCCAQPEPAVLRAMTISTFLPSQSLLGGGQARHSRPRQICLGDTSGGWRDAATEVVLVRVCVKDLGTFQMHGFAEAFLENASTPS